MTPEQNAPSQPNDSAKPLKFSRRRFLQGAGAVIASTALAGLTEPASAPARGLSLEEEKLFTIDAELQKKIESAIEGGVGFLKNQYDEEVGLLQEAPEAEKDKHNYWINTSTTIACKALEAIGEEDLRGKLEKRVAELKQEFQDKEHLFRHGVVEAINGEVIELPPRTAPNIDDTKPLKVINGKNIITETRNGDEMHDYEEYADLGLWAALSAHNEGNKELALERYQAVFAPHMFDGNGFTDKGDPEGIYNTYKLSLALHVGHELGLEPNEKTDKMLQIVLSMQDTADPNTGGFTSYYIAEKGSEGTSLVRKGDPNVETTALSLRALSHYVQPAS